MNQESWLKHVAVSWGGWIWLTALMLLSFVEKCKSGACSAAVTLLSSSHFPLCNATVGNQGTVPHSSAWLSLSVTCNDHYFTRHQSPWNCVVLKPRIKIKEREGTELKRTSAKYFLCVASSRSCRLCKQLLNLCEPCMPGKQSEQRIRLETDVNICLRTTTEHTVTKTGGEYSRFVS